MTDITDIVVIGASIMSAQANTIAIKDALKPKGFDVTVHNRAVGGEDLAEILLRAQAATAEFDGQQSTTLFQFHGGGNNLDGQGWPHAAAEIEQGLRDVINHVVGEGFPISTSTLSWRNPAVGGVDTAPYNDNIYIPVINELTPLWGGSRTVVDLWTAFFESQDWISGDGTHPTAEGDYETALYIGRQMSTKMEPTLTKLPRSVLDLKAANFGTLNTDAVFSGNFEIAITYALNATATGSQNLLGSSDNRNFLNVNHDAKTVGIKINNTFTTMSAPALPDADADVHYIVFYRRGSTVHVVFDDIYLGSQAVSNQPGDFNLVGVRSSSTRIDGAMWDVKMWSGGNRQTGSAVLDIPFNEVGSDTQTDLASGNTLTLTGVNHGTDWASKDDWA